MSSSASGGGTAPEEFPEYDSYDGLGLADLVSSKEVKAEELLETAIRRIEKVNPRLNAIVTEMYDEARQSVSSGLSDGPFIRGVPFLLKDLGATYAGVRLTGGSRVFAENVPDYDNELVRRYKAAGLVTVGRTNTPQFGLNVSTESAFLGPAPNPWNSGRSTGGSSGGSAAAVAARIVPIAHASDGGGSIRIPASCCGLFGMKPSRGRMPTGPEFGEIWEGFGINHAVSISVRDDAALLDATSAPEIGAPYGIQAPVGPFLKEVGAAPGRLRIAFFTKGASNQTHPECIAAVKDAAELCEGLGHRVEEASPAIAYAPLLQAFQLVVRAHTASLAQPDRTNAGKTSDSRHGRTTDLATGKSRSKGISSRSVRDQVALQHGYQNRCQLSAQLRRDPHADPGRTPSRARLFRHGESPAGCTRGTCLPFHPLHLAAQRDRLPRHVSASVLE